MLSRGLYFSLGAFLLLVHFNEPMPWPLVFHVFGAGIAMERALGGRGTAAVTVPDKVEPSC